MHDEGKATASQRLGAALMSVAGLGLIGYAVLFMIQNIIGLIEIGISPAEVGKTKEQILTFSPGVYNYISHVQAALGAFIAATGLATAFMAWYGVRRGQGWAWWGVVLTTVVWAVVATPFHYVYGFGSLAHLGPTYLALILIGIGAYLARLLR